MTTSIGGIAIVDGNAQRPVTATAAGVLAIMSVVTAVILAHRSR